MASELQNPPYMADKGSRQAAEETVVLERRKHHRYNVALPIRYRLAHRRAKVADSAATICEMSAVGLSFRSQPLPVGSLLDMVIAWPIRFGDAFPIELHAAGRVLRCAGGRTAVSITSRRFHVLEIPDAALAAGAVV
jgi:hypothetical protein